MTVAFHGTSSTTSCTLRMTNGRGRLFALAVFHIHLISRISLLRMKASNDQLDDRIVEVHWDPDLEHWRMMRFRDDKPNGNHKSVVDNIIKSIADGVEKDAVRVSPSHLPFRPVIHRFRTC